MKRPLTEAASRALDNAARLAQLAGGDAVEPIHLLWALVLDESQAAERMARHGVTREAIRDDLPEEARGSEELPAADVAPPEHGPGLERVLREAGVCVRRSVSMTEVGSEQLLWGLATVPSPAAALLKQHGIEPETIPTDGDGTVVGEPLPVDFEFSPFSRDSEFVGQPFQADRASPARPESIGRSGQAGKPDVLRILDAAANRAREGLRVVEDFVRFELDDAHLTRELKECRHELAAALTEAGCGDWLPARDTPGDVGTRLSTPAESVRTSPFDVAQANFKRLQEALRSLEEYGKCVSPQFGARCEAVRYRLYTLEKAVLGTAANRERLADCRLYWLLTRDDLRRKAEGGRRKAEPWRMLPASAKSADAGSVRHGDSPVIHNLLSESADNWLDQQVQDALRSGVDIVQIREKELPDAELLDWTRTVRRWTRETGTLLIMNDRPDLAVLCEADGVHVGQDELSVADVRRIVGPRMLVGVSTHNIEQARRAVLDGADYLGVGPVFPSGTKSFESLAGLDYVRLVAAEISLPWFAIGGIDESNVAAVVEAGATRIAVSGALSNADSPEPAAGRLRRTLCGQAAPTSAGER